MALKQSRFIRQLKPQNIRWLFYLAIVLAIAAWRFLPRPWHPTLTVETAHYKIYSTATEEQTSHTGRALEILYLAYSNRMAKLKGWQAEHPRLQVKLFKDRAEMRWINPGMDWAEAFYQEPFCRAYYSDGEINPYHWMLHESVHQLNHEVAHIAPAKWLEEGLAEYFSTCQLTSNGLAMDIIDLNTYPVWWMDEIASSSNLVENIRNGSVIPLRAIITGKGGPAMNQNVNLYYLHWWTLTRFIFENKKYHDHALALVERSGTLDAFEDLIGPVDQVQNEWHDYVRQLKVELKAEDRAHYKNRKVPKPFETPAPLRTNL